jgi:acyl carrier protein
MILEKLLKIIEKYSFNKDIVRNAKLNSKIIADLNINSTRIVDIIMDIEEEFDIEIEDKALNKMLTIEDVINIIKNTK